MAMCFDGKYYCVFEKKTGFLMGRFATAAEALAYVRRES
jgi:hypothetical protein